MASRWLGVVVLCAGFGCASKPKKPFVHPVVKLAQFDLDCPRGKLKYTKIDKDTYGVRGCGQRARYVRVCRQKLHPFGYLEDQCRWVLN